VSDRHKDKLRYMISLGLLPGAHVAVVERAPFGGPITIRVGRKRCAIDGDLAELVHVSPAGAAGARTPSARKRRAK
jgi:DtxR family Mn-dependent transcriptional regulator